MEAFEGADDGGGNFFGAEEFAGDLLDLLAGDGFQRIRSTGGIGNVGMIRRFCMVKLLA